MRIFKNIFAVLALFAACLAIPAPAYAQQISGQGAASYTSNEWYDRSTRDSNTRVSRYLACAQQGLYYMPSHPEAVNGCAMIKLVDFRIDAGRTTLAFENTTPGSFDSPAVVIKGDTGAAGHADLCSGWVTGGWGECQSNHTRTRSVSCGGSNCCTAPPSDSEPCTYVPPVCTPWTWGNWSSCDAGQTTQTRSATCPFADVSRCCDQPSPNPESQECPAVCDGTWIFQGWGACQADGTQQAQYNCSTSCCTGEAPIERQPCEGSSSGGGMWNPQYGACNATPRWETGEWGNCGPMGNQSRTVTCVGQDGERPVSYTCSTSSGCAEPEPVGGVGQACSLTCQGAGIPQPATTQSCEPPLLGECRCSPGMKPWGYGGVIYGCVPKKPEGMNYTHASEPCLVAAHSCPCIGMRTTGTHCLPEADYSGEQCPTGFATHVGRCAGGDMWDFSGMGPGMNNVGTFVCNFAR